MADHPTQQDVLLALLAFDSYSRGKHPQIEYRPDVPLAESIGTATWELVSDRLDGATAAGFSASKYTLPGNTVVISYRGTDFPAGFNWTQLKAVLNDVWYGWASSITLNGTGGNSQPAFAQKFYELVTEQSLFPIDTLGGGGQQPPPPPLGPAPAVLTGQYYVAELAHAEHGMRAPVACVTWASVSDEVAERLAQGGGPGARLKPEEWTSGANLWLTHLAGEPNALAGALQMLAQTRFKDTPVRLTMRDGAGAVRVATLQDIIASDANARGAA